MKNFPAHTIRTGKIYDNGVLAGEFISNRQRRLCLDWNQLTVEEQKEFDYHDPEDDRGDFFRYKGQVYDISQFTRLEDNSHWRKAGWHAAEASSAFSGTVIHICVDDPDYVIVGQWRG